MAHERDEQVIFVKDLLFAALYQWRKILIAGIAVAVLVGGIMGIAQWRAASSTPSEEVVQEEVEKYETQRELLKKAVEDAEKLIESQELYHANSSLMALDPYNVYKATVELTIPTGDRAVSTDPSADYTGAFLRAYAVYLSSDEIINEAAQATQTEAKYLREMVIFTDGKEATRSLNITVLYPNAEGAQKILDAILGHMDQAKEQVRQNVGDHRVSVVASSVNACIDLTVIEKQTDAMEHMEDLEENLENAQAQLAALQTPFFGSGTSTKKIVILAILGGILGAGLVACVVWFDHIAGGKVYSARTLKNKTGLRILGCAPARKVKNPIDLWLKKLERRCVQDDQLAIITANAVNYCADNAPLLITGDCDAADMEKMAETLKASGIQVIACGSLLRSPEALAALPQCGSVLLVEKCGRSRYSHVLQIMERVEDQQKNLIGCVILDG